jgi:ribosomal-protein-alanine N-acetyltransferase
VLFRRRDPVYTARFATPADTDAVRRLVEHARRVYLRIPLEEALFHLRSGLGWVAGEGDHIAGLILTEIQPTTPEDAVTYSGDAITHIASIVAAAVSDDWRVAPYLDTFLPLVEEAVRQKGATALVQIGHAPWLTAVLDERGFIQQDWVVTYEWHSQPVTVRGNLSVAVRSAHLRDLPTLVSLDERIFGPIWHKPAPNFTEALAQAFIFTVAETEGQIVGYQWSDKIEEHGHLTRLGARPGWEGRGVGTRLLTEVLVAMVNAGVTWVTLNTQESNVRSRELYERHGFHPTGERVAVLYKDLKT